MAKPTETATADLVANKVANEQRNAATQGAVLSSYGNTGPKAVNFNVTQAENGLVGSFYTPEQGQVIAVLADVNAAVVRFRSLLEQTFAA